MSREMMVGGEHIVGGRGHDYDELMELGAEPARQPIQIRQAPPPAQHPQAPPQGTPATTREIHHHYGPPPDHASQDPRAHEQPQRRRIVAEEPTHERQFPIGFGLENIAPGDEEDIEVKPQVYFRGERLAIPPSIARYFDVLDIKVGKDSQLAATGTMPGESFSAHAVGVRMELDTAKPGIVITLRVRNVDTAAHDFKAVLYGAVLE
ncbi:MAG: hypothetical protein ACRELY_08760 [Polyangiaceae bacterium]